MTRRRRPHGTAFVLGALVAGALGLAVVAGLTNTPTLDERARALDLELRCPACQGVSIADSPSTSAAQMRRIVRDRLAGGSSEAEVRAFFVARFGTWVLLAPPGDGFGAVLWVLPGAAMLVGVGTLLWQARRPRVMVRSRTPDAAADGDPATAAFGARLPATLGVGLLVVAIAVPLAVAIVPRVAGQEISGRPAAGSLLGLSELEARAVERPGDVDVALDLAAAYLDAERTADAAATYATLLRDRPDLVEALLGLGVASLDGGRPDAALSLFDRALAVDPSLPDAYLYRALARFSVEGGPSAATGADVRRFIQLVPGDPRVPTARGLLDAAVPSSPRNSP